MVRSPVREEGVKKGPWTPEEDRKLIEYVAKHGRGSWQRLPKLAGLNRCGKSCRLRWTNYLRPDIKRGKFTQEEEQLIIHLHSLLGNKWSLIATKLPGRTDNEIKNYWNTRLRKKLLRMGIDPITHRPTASLNLLKSLSNLLSAANLGGGNMTSHLDNALKLQADAANLVKLQLMQSLMQTLTSTCTPNMDLMNLLSSPNSPGNYQIEACLGGTFNLQNPVLPVTPNLSTLGSQYLNNSDLQSVHVPEYPSFSMDEGEPAAVADVPSTSASFPALSNPPPFVSASPDAENIDLIKSSDDICTNSVAFTSLEAWDNMNLMDNLEIDLGLKEIIDQIPWPNASYGSGDH